MAVRTDILRACAAVTLAPGADRALLPASVAVAARVVRQRSPRGAGERFCLPAPDARRTATELVEFHWLAETPHEIRIVRSTPGQGEPRHGR